MTKAPNSIGKMPDAALLVGAPHSRQVVGGGCQRPLHGDLLQPAPAKPSHSSLLFQHPVHRFDNRFASAINRAAHGVAQFPAHAAMRGVLGPQPQPATAVQPARQIRVRNMPSMLRSSRARKLSNEKNPVSALARWGFSP